MPQYAKEFGTLSINKGSKWDWRIKATVPFFCTCFPAPTTFQ